MELLQHEGSVASDFTLALRLRDPRSLWAHPEKVRRKRGFLVALVTAFFGFGDHLDAESFFLGSVASDFTSPVARAISALALGLT